MPGGICAGSGPNWMPATGAARKASLTIRLDQISTPINILLSGVAVASFPEHLENEIENLDVQEEVSVQWGDVQFAGKSDILGEIHASLQNVIGTSPSTGIVRSLARDNNANTGIDNSTNSFFPAINTNSFNFKIRVPRFGLEYRTQEPLINEAEITQIPPYDSVYSLKNKIKFKSITSPESFLDTAKRSLTKAFSNLFSSVSSRTAGEISIETCNVKFVLPGGLSGEVQLISDNFDTSEFQVTLENDSEFKDLMCSWMIWPKPEVQNKSNVGFIKLKTAQKKFNITIPRDIFYRERWLVVVSSEPFENDIAGAFKFPPLV